MAKKLNPIMKQKRNGLSILGFAIVLFGIFGFIASQKSRVAVAAFNEPIYVAELSSISIPVPENVVPAGTPIEKIKLRVVSLPENLIKGTDAVVDLSVLQGKIAQVPLTAGMPLYLKNFEPQTNLINPVIDNIPQGMRAMTIKVDAQNAIEGWAGSGAYVDLLLVEKNLTTVIAENVKILSAERSVAPVESNAPSIPSTFTLLVTQEQCLAINTAMPRGKIAFALRNNSDLETWNAKTFSADSLSRHNISEKVKSSVNGFVEIKGEKGRKLFALSNDKWIKTSSKPEGFLVGDPNETN